MSQPTEGMGQPTGQTVPNYLVFAILTTIFCCLPFGIVSIVYAAQVNSHLTAGNYAAAVAASNNAKRWAWISFGVGLVVDLIVLVLQVLAVMMAVQQGQPMPGQPMPG